MPINELGMNDDIVNYFSLEDYVSRINILPDVLSHLEYTSNSFDDYMAALKRYDSKHIIGYWIFSLYNELEYSQNIENQNFNAQRLVEKGIFFDTLTISHKRIHELHNFVTEGELENTFEYRKTPVNVSYYDTTGQEHIYWRGAKPEAVNKFMNDFINLYRQNRVSLLFSNPFLSSALMHLLFVRIHPYTDGNGRTARIIHNIKFTENINKLYGMKLKISPLNLSESILLNKITYVKRIDQIYFNVENDTNAAINNWFDFILDMADEQIYKSSEMLSNIPEEFLNTTPEEDKNVKGLKKAIKSIK